MADVTVQFADGSSHVYQGVPDSATPDAVEARATKDFGKKVVSLGKGAAAAAVPPPPAAAAPADPHYPKGALANLAAGAETFGHGASFGLSDNLGGIVDALISPSSRGFVTDMRENIAARKADRQGFEQSGPVASAVAHGLDAAGATAGVIGTAGEQGGMLALKAGKPILNLLKMGVNALPYGVVQGAADADVGQGTSGALMGGAAAAAGGTLLGGFMAGAGAIAKPAFGALANLAAKAGDSLFGAAGNPLARYATTATQVPNKAAIGPLLDALQSAGQTPQDLRAAIQAAPAGAQESIATAAAPGGAVQQLGKRAVLQAGPGKDIGRAAIDDSISGMLPNIQGKLSDMSGLPVQDTGPALQALQEARSAASRDAYSAIPDTPLVLQPKDADLITSLESNPAYRDAHDAFVSAHNASHSAEDAVQPLWGDPNSPRMTRTPTQQDLDAITRNIGDKVGQLKIQRQMGTLPSGGGDEYVGLGKAYQSLQDLVKGTDVAPELVAARDQHAAATDVIKGMQSGQEAGMVGQNADPFMTSQEIAKFGPEGQQAFKLGTLDSINNRMRTLQDTAKAPNLPTEVIGRGDEGGKKQDMLKAVFGDTEAVGNFINQMTTLGKRFDVRNMVSRDGSFENMANALDETKGMAIAGAHGGPHRMAWHFLGNRLDQMAGYFNRDANKAIASEIFTPRAGDQADAFLNMLDQVAAARQKSQARMPALSRAATVSALQLVPDPSPGQ